MTENSRTKLIPRETLFGNPVRTQPRISPDGTRLAYIAPVEGVLNVWAGELESEDYRPVTRDEYRGVRIFFWAEDGEHILYLQDADGDENWHLYATGLDTGETRELTPFEEVQVQVVARDKNHPDELLVGHNRENPELHDVYRLTLSTGELEQVAKNPGTVVGWVTDAQFRVRGAVAATSEGGMELMLRETEDAEWETRISWDREDALTSGPLTFSESGEKLYLLDSREFNTARLVELDLATGESSPLAEDPRYDVSDALVHPDTHEVQAVAFDKARTEWLVLDDDIHEDFTAIQKLHPGDFSVLGRTRDDSTWVIGFTADDGPTAFYAYHRSDRTGEHLFDDRPELADYELSNMQPISYETRDGLTVQGYLTLPEGSGESPPLVLNVHGGPWARDMWGYDPEAQWFANRGYACLQVNYRGSTGYGKKFLNAGNKEWGAKMHDDLIDAVEWAIAEGYADRDRLAIFGGSYGGYAALAGAAFTPEVFQCAVDIVGPSNLITLIESVPPYWWPMISQFHDRVGNPETEAEFLKSRSPLFSAENITIPLLIAQGANDPRVKQAESEQIVSALEENGVEHEYLLFEDEGHGFARPENRLKFYAAAEEFLARHLGGRAEG